MSKIKLPDIFTGELYGIIYAYKKRIQRILDEYDIAIFMARKAICFYDALRYNEEITETDCKVISSRVVDYNTLEELRNKKIAVIDDVVVRGKSISRVATILSQEGIEADYYVVACEESFSNSFNKDIKLLEETYNIFSRYNIYQLSGIITKYIESSMRTFNVDSPIFDLSENYNSIQRILRDSGALNLTSGLQSKYKIDNRTLYFDIDINSLDKKSEISQIIENSIIKIRFYCDDTRVFAIPFVLLPQCDTKLINSFYELFKNDKTDNLIECKDARIIEENKLKIVSYLLSDTLFHSFAKSMGLTFKKDIQNEMFQFNKDLDELLPYPSRNSLLNLFEGIKIKGVNLSKFELIDFVKMGYQFISTIDPDTLKYENYKGEKYGSEDDDKNKLTQIAFSFSDMLIWITNNIGENENNEIYVSSVIDIFIDMGFIVPAILHIKESTILRAYKMGEYSKLTREQINSFINMLFEYENKTQKGIERIEFEKLCVLFFKQEISLNHFRQVENYEEGCYGIAYTYYGPRVSTSNIPYVVPEDTPLITDLSGENRVAKRYRLNNKIYKDYRKGARRVYTVPYPKDVNDDVLENASTSFAAGFAEIKRIFEEHPYERGNSYWGSCIHTFPQYLTILAIGNNPKNQILSLCAEIFWVKELNEILTLNPSNLSVEKYQKCLKGINSGLWKYRCFKKKALKKASFNLQSLNVFIAAYIMPMNTIYDCSKYIYDFLDECGTFLYKSAYIINEVLYKKNYLDDYRFDDELTYEKGGVWGKDPKTIFNISNYYFEDFKDLRKNIKNNIEEAYNSDSFYETTQKYNNELIKEATNILNKCDLYLENENARICEIQQFLVVYSKNSYLPNDYKGIKPCGLKDFSNSKNIQVFSIPYKNEAAHIISNVLTQTQDVNDCKYIMIDLSESDNIGYFQVSENAKGGEAKNIIDRIINVISRTSLETCRCLYFYQNYKPQYKSFRNIKIKLLETFQDQLCDSFKLYKYLIESEDNNMNIKISAESGASVVVGDSNEVKIDNSKNTTINAEGLMDELKLAINEISKSNELTDSEKESLISVMEKAKTSIENNSENEKKDAKDRFNLIKGFIVDKAPSILANLANLSQLAIFFGLQPPIF